LPDDLLKKLSDVLNNLSISPEDEITGALVEMARDISLIEPNPVVSGWGNII
jgi:hypothetical protein